MAMCNPESRPKVGTLQFFKARGVLFLLALGCGFLWGRPMTPPTVLPVTQWGIFPNDSKVDGKTLQRVVDSLQAQAFQILGRGKRVDRASRFKRTVLWFPSGIYLLEQPLEIDLSVVSIEGRGAIFQAVFPTKESEKSCSYLVRLYSSLQYHFQRGENLWGRQLGFFSGISLIPGDRPGTRAPRVALWIGPLDPHQCPDARAQEPTRNAFFLLQNLEIHGFPVAIRFGNHTWRITVENALLSQNDTLFFAPPFPPEVRDFGENMRILNSVLSGGETVLATGEFHFEGCSFLNHTLKILNDARVWVSQSHFENPGQSRPPYRFAVVEGKDALLSISQTELVLGKPTGSGIFDRAIFWVSPEARRGGLILRDLYTFRQPYYQPERHDGNRVLVAGGGAVYAKGIRTYSDWGGMYVIASSLNELINGGAEQGLKGWETSGRVSVGGPSVAQNGDSCFVFQGKSSLSQTLAVAPGDVIWIQAWGKAIPSPSPNELKVQFSLSSSNASLDTTWTVWTFRSEQTSWTVQSPPYVVIPPGYHTLRITFLHLGTDSSKYLLDDVIVNRT